MNEYYRKTVWTRLFDVFNAILMCLFMLTILFPFWNQLCISLSDISITPVSNITFYPQHFNTEAYQRVFSDVRIVRATGVSVLRVLVGTVGTLFCTGLLAYVTTIQWFSGRKLLRRAFVVTMYFGAGLIPTYLAFISIGLYNTFWVMVLPFSVSVSNIIVARTFFQNSLPGELWDAAQVDGCGNLRFFFTMALPLSKAVISVIALWTAVGQWNSYFNALIYIRDSNLHPLQLIMRNILITNQSFAALGTGEAAIIAMRKANLVRYSMIIVSTVPIMCVYPFIQKYFDQGVMIGSVKG